MRKAVVFSGGGDNGITPVLGRVARAKIFGWMIYGAGFAIWLFDRRPRPRI
jgi:hypothetical protein